MLRRLALCLLLLPLAACQSDAARVAELAEARWRKGEYDEAIRLNLMLYDQDPGGRQAAQALLNIGNIYYLNLRDLPKAIEYYNRLAGEFPGRAEEYKARLQLAGIYANELGDLTQAISEYDRILEWEDLENRPEVQFERANAYFKKEDFERALRELRRIEESGITGHFQDKVLLKIGSIYQIRKRFEEAVAPFERVAESPCLECRRQAILSLADTYENLFDFDRAIETIRRLDRSEENDELISREVARLESKRRRIG